MNRPALRLTGALFALVAAAAVLAVTVAGFVGLAVAVVLSDPWSHGRIAAAGFLVAGLVLLLLAHVVDRQALHRAGVSARSVASQLVVTVVSAGQR